MYKCRIPDPSAVKPDDWDEDAPQKIEDAEAEKPEGWLDNEPAEVVDPGGLTRCACLRETGIGVGLLQLDLRHLQRTMLRMPSTR